MFVTNLNERTKKVLQAIVESYIETAMPVSSQAIAQLFRQRISAATIRNVMAELDDLGLIFQPHTSAGRIPTDKGYRYYIDTLLSVEQLTKDEQEFIESQYLIQDEVFDELLHAILRILSNFMGYTAIAFSAGLKKILFRKLELVCVQSTKLLVVMVSQEGMLKTTVVQLPYTIGQMELVKIAKFLNEEFNGLTLGEIKARLSLRLLSSSDSFFYLLKKATDILDLSFNNFNKDKLYYEGTSYIFEHPEFQDSQKLQAILRTLEKQEPLLRIMKEDIDGDGVKVHIGQENQCQDIQECSLVVSNFKLRNVKMGALGIIGPRRMSYAKVISAVDYAARIFSERMFELSM
jgi:heat-inducible transcriptional repressor